MNRRDFLKTVPALAALGAATPGLAQLTAAQIQAPPTSGPAAASRPALRLPPIQLAKPETEGGKSVLASLWDRKTTRTIADKALPPQVLSNLLFAAFGMNREKGPAAEPGAPPPPPAIRRKSICMSRWPRASICTKPPRIA